MDDPLRAVTSTASSALRAQSERIKTVSENVANAFSTGASPEEDPYRRKMVSFEAGGALMPLRKGVGRHHFPHSLDNSAWFHEKQCLLTVTFS